MNLVTSYELSPNNPITPDRFILSALELGPDNINLNCFIAPLHVLNSTDKINFIIQSSDFGNYNQEYTYPYGEYYEDSIVPILPYGVLFACLANPNNLTLPNIPLGGSNELYRISQDIIRIIIQLITQDTVRYNCEIYVLPANLEPSKITNIGYATIKEALTILSGSMSGRTQTDFIRKSELINLNADSSKLTKYGDNDFVNVPDIKATNPSGLILNLPLTSSYSNKDLVTNTYVSIENGSLTYSSDGAYFNGSSNLYLNETKFKLSGKRVTVAFRFKSESKSYHNSAFLFGYGSGEEFQCNTPESGQMNVLLKTYNFTNGCWLTRPMSYNTWYNVVCRYDGSYYKLRVSGSEVSSVGNNDFPGTLSGILRVGGYLNDKFKGTMRNFRVWDRALTDTEVSSLTF